MMDKLTNHVTTEDIRIAASNGISRRALEQRIFKLGMDKSMAIKAPINTARRKWLPVALANGIKKCTFDYRYYELDWDPEVAATKPTEKRVWK